MADHADDGGNNNDVFIYMGGFIPLHLRVTTTHARVHKSVKIITLRAFERCTNLVSIEIHDGVEIIEAIAFCNCKSLRRIKLPGVRVIEEYAFDDCTALEDVEFGDKLETIERCAFQFTALRNIKIPKVRAIGYHAFSLCKHLTDIELSKDLERIETVAFGGCRRLRRIAMPLKANLFDENNNVFHNCDDLSQVDLVGGIHKTVSSLLLERWRNDMKDEIARINQVLPNILLQRPPRIHQLLYTPSAEKTGAIRQWMGRVLERMEHYKSEHYALLKEDMTQLELALWKSNLPNIDAAESRHEARVTCGANIIIPQVLSFLNNEEAFPTVRNISL
jgi:hypothetical protein